MPAARARRASRAAGRAALALALAAAAAAAPSDGAGDERRARGDRGWIEAPAALLQGLDKITARVSTFEVPVGAEGAHGALRVAVRACRRRPPTETPESAAFLEISERRPGEAPALVFSGWMFASSPALHAMEHPVYDVRLLACKSASTAAASSGGPSKEAGRRSASSSSER